MTLVDNDYVRTKNPMPVGLQPRSAGISPGLKVTPVDMDKILAQDFLDVPIGKSTGDHGFRDVRQASYIFNSVREIGTLRRQVVLNQPFLDRTVIINEIRS
jgi:hypothetical protein